MRLRRALINNWKRNAFRENKLGQLEFSRAQHDRWMDAHGRQARIFMNGEEFGALQRAKGVDAALRNRDAARVRVQRELAESFPGEVVRLNRPETIANRMLNPADGGGYARGVMEIMEGALPEETRAVRAAIKTQVERRIMDANRIVSPSKMNKLVGGGPEDIQPALRAVFGDQYVDDLITLNEAVKVASRQAAAPNFSNTAIASKALMDLGRAYVGLFTRPGRVLTAFSRIRGRAANQAIMSVMLEPESLRRVMALKDADPKSREWRQLMISLGATAMITDFNEIEALTSEAQFPRQVP